MVPESLLLSVVIRMQKMNNMAINDNCVVGELRAITGEKRTQHVRFWMKNNKA
jgi:hypothetical protein